MSAAAPDIPALGPEQTEFERVQAAYAQNPRAMTMLLARELGVPEALVVRAMPDGRSLELDASRWEAMLRAFEELGQVHVIVSNGAVTIESVGAFGGFSQGGGFFNVQGEDLDMHIRHDNLASAFAVRKPSHLSGVDTLSIQFFDQDGTAAFKVFLTFGNRDPSGEREAQFAALVDAFQLV